MPSLLGLHLGRYDPASSKPSKGWCNEVPYDDSEAEAEWEEYIRRHGSLDSNQFDDTESIASLKIEEASEEAIEDEIEQTQLEERASLDSRATRYELESPTPRFFNLPVRVSSELASDSVETVKMEENCQEEDAKGARDNNEYETEQDAIAAKYLTPEQLAEEDDDDDVVFALTPETCPGPPSPRELPTQKLSLRIFVATWNMAAKDPFAHRRRGQYIGDDLAAETLRELLPLGYDIYVVGTQEKVTKHLNEAVLARLQQQGKYQRLVATTKQQNRTHDDCEHLRHLKTYESSDFGSSAGLTSFCGSEAACNLCSPHATSAYSATSPRGRFFSDDVPTTRNSMPQTETVDSDVCCSWWKKNSEEKEIRGHGDHALIRRKSTGLVIYHVRHLHGRIQVVAAGSHKFTGSKGGIAVTIRVAGDPQTLTFVNCHLEANRIERRRRQLEKLTRELPRALGFTRDEATLATCSDHVIWMGDFNYRIKELAGNEVIGLLSAGRLQELHDHYDSMADDLENVPGLRMFREPAKWPTFYPTYKKIKCRSKLPLSGSVTGTGQDTRWAQHVYQTAYREPFYKGGRVRERVPGWCDRILYCSRPNSVWTENLEVEQAACSDASRGRSSFSSDAVRDNYRALNDDLRGSDHSPVSCTFNWVVQR